MLEIIGYGVLVGHTDYPSPRAPVFHFRVLPPMASALGVIGPAADGWNLEEFRAAPAFLAHRGADEAIGRRHVQVHRVGLALDVEIDLGSPIGAQLVREYQTGARAGVAIHYGALEITYPGDGRMRRVSRQKLLGVTALAPTPSMVGTSPRLLCAVADICISETADGMALDGPSDQMLAWSAALTIRELLSPAGQRAITLS